jgi:hypothetical protein
MLKIEDSIVMLNLRKKLENCYKCSVILNGGKTWTLGERDKKYLERFYTWYWRRMEISWTDRERNEEILQSRGG